MIEISKQLLFFLSALGAFNGFLLSGYLLTVKKGRSAYLFLSVLLLMVSIRVAKSVFFYFSPDIAKSFLQLGLSACFFIGPMLYFYCAASTQQLNKQTLKWQYHLVLLIIVTLGFGAITPYHEYPQLWGSFIYKLINLSWFVYIVAATPYIWPIIKTYYQEKKSLSRDSILLISVYFGISLIWSAYFFASYTSYIVGALSFTFSFYLSIFLVILHYKPVKNIKYLDKKIENSIAKPLVEQLEQLMNNEKTYCDANLTLAKLARKLAIPTAQLSQLLNDNLQKSFSTVMNEYRIEEAKRLLRSDKRLTMENIIDNCGYNSLSTFYNAFKKIEGITPAKYRELHL